MSADAAGTRIQHCHPGIRPSGAQNTWRANHTQDNLDTKKKQINMSVLFYLLVQREVLEENGYDAVKSCRQPTPPRHEQPRTRTTASTLASSGCIIAISDCCFAAITVAVLQTHSEHHHQNNEHQNEQGQQNNRYTLDSKQTPFRKRHLPHCEAYGFLTARKNGYIAVRDQRPACQRSAPCSNMHNANKQQNDRSCLCCCNFDCTGCRLCTPPCEDFAKYHR